MARTRRPLTSAPLEQRREGARVNVKRAHAAQPSVSTQRAVSIRYTQGTRILVAGAVTRRRYEFSAASALQQVDARDAPALLDTRFFVRA
jgi:hypothetical protein